MRQPQKGAVAYPAAVTSGCRPTDTNVLRAEWVLERLPSEQVPDIAVAALEAGCNAPTMAVVAGLKNPGQLT
jgi:hypothetical protein